MAFPPSHAIIMCDWSQVASPQVGAGLMGFFAVAAQSGHSVLISPEEAAIPDHKRPTVIVQLAGCETPETLLGWATLLGFGEQYREALPPSSDTAPALIRT